MSSPNKYGPNPVKAQSVQEISLLSGGIYIENTATYTGPFIAIKAVADAVVTLTSTPSKGGIQGTLTSVPLPVTAGLLVGPFDTVTAASGKLFAYFGPFAR